MALTITLDNVGNPDFGQDPGRRLPGTRREVVDVADLAEASRLAVAYIAGNHLGGGNWPDARVTKDGQPFARVSYNGCAWPPGTWRSDMAPLYDPRPRAEPGRDPDAYDEAELDIGGGLRVAVTGCFRVGTWRLRGDTARVHAEMLMGRVEFARDDEPKLIRCQKGAGAKALYQRIDEAIRAWYAEPEGRALVLGNEVKDRRSAMAHAERQVAHREDELGKARDARVVARDALAGAESDLADLATASPRP